MVAPSVRLADLAAIGRLDAVGVERGIDGIGSGRLNAVVHVIAEIKAIRAGDVVVDLGWPAAIPCSDC